jgi:glycine/sarcosine N-methyltransferase
MSTNHYSHFDYRKLIAWDKRLTREWVFLASRFAAAPGKRVLDLGSGTGEHARFFAEQGYAVVGVDVSDAMLARARETGVPDGVDLVKGDLLHVDTVVTGPFAAAVCLGNTVAHFLDADALAQMFAGVRRLITPGGPFILQVLNYEHLAGVGQRCLPLTFIDDEDGEEIFLRVMTFRPGGRVTFTPTILRYRPDDTPAMEVATSHNVELHAWTRDDIDSALEAAGFAERTFYGSMADVPFVAADSHDLVVVAR